MVSAGIQSKEPLCDGAKKFFKYFELFTWPKLSNNL